MVSFTGAFSSFIINTIVEIFGLNPPSSFVLSIFWRNEDERNKNCMGKYKYCLYP